MKTKGIRKRLIILLIVIILLFTVISFILGVVIYNANFGGRIETAEALHYALDLLEVFFDIPQVDCLSVIFKQSISISHKEGLQLFTAHFLDCSIGVTVDDFLFCHRYTSSFAKSRIETEVIDFQSSAVLRHSSNSRLRKSAFGRCFYLKRDLHTASVCIDQM